jgi:glutamate N-acetyltransferase/amino-acid N-acetyltransferase
VSVGVCLARGFSAAGVRAGIKHSGAPDVALVASDRPAAAAAVFTRNRLVSPAVSLSRAHVADGGARAIVTNSGNANACTGAQGVRDAAAMAASAASALDLDERDVLVASTGVIGVPLPMERVRAGVAAAAVSLSPEGGGAAAEAICTTDAGPKLAGVDLALAGGAVRVGGMAKGAGMIRPDMATTLCQVTTDAEVPAAVLQRLLRAACDASFNLISVDGSTSTNDCAIVLANGAAGVAVSPADERGFGDALTQVMLALAKQIVRDGEGASRYCRYELVGARDDGEANAGVRAVGEDILVRCALHGADPNWGRMLVRLGTAGIELDPARIGVWFGDTQLVAGGEAVPGAEPAAQAALAQDEAHVRIDLGLGGGRALVYASALSPAYVEFNAEYTT